MPNRFLTWLHHFTHLSWRDRLVCAGVAAGVVGMLGGAVTLLLSQSQAPTPVVQQACRVDTREVVVDVSGAVNQPGVYTVGAEARVSELIDRAGGLSEHADLWHIAHELNLAQLIEDGQKIYIPVKEELALRTPIGVGETVVAGTNGTAAPHKISLNNASQKELETLSGIGAVRAAAIIAQRPYTTINELVEKEVLSVTALKKIEANLSL